MGTKFFISALFICLALQANAQTIPNTGFENWTMQAGGYEDPDGWKTNNVSNGVSVSKTTDSHSGSFALQVINNFPWIEGPLTGYSATVFNDTNVVSKISTYVKCDSLSGFGKGVIIIDGYSDTLYSHIGYWETSIEIPQYTLIDIPITTLLHFDSIGVYIMSLGHHDSQGQSDGYAALKVDDITKETISDVEKVKSYQTLGVTPNPFEEYSILKFENPTAENSTLTIYDIRGKLVRTIDNVSTGEIKIERKNLSSGVYTFKIQSDKRFGRGEFIVQ